MGFGFKEQKETHLKFMKEAALYFPSDCRPNLMTEGISF